MARIQIFHPDESIAKELRKSGHINGEHFFMKDVLTVVEDVYRETNLNVMIQRHGTEDCTIWVDKGRFRQK